MVTSRLLAAGALLTLLAGCGGDDAESMQDGLAPAQADVGAAAPPAAAPVVPDSAAAPAPGLASADSTPEISPAERAEPVSIEGRESFSYTGGSRDPFISLLLNSMVGPELPDLDLVAVYYDVRTPLNSVIVLREKIGAKKHTLRQGDRIGRIRVQSIRPKDVTFAIDDFGTERLQTVPLRTQEETP